jgi:SAM-dependent methyltransferase
MKRCLNCDLSFSSPQWSCPGCGNFPEEINGFLSFSPGIEANSGFNEDFFSKLADLESKNFWFQSRNRLIIFVLRQYFPYAKKFLEVGCGTGFVLNGILDALPSLKIYGSEISVKGLSYAYHRLPNIDLFQMDARSIPFRGELDIIGAFDVLEHIEDDIKVLSEMNSALKSTGGIIITVPQHKFLWSASDEHAHHIRRYSKKDLIEKIEGAGFIIERITSFVSLLLPIMILSRMNFYAKNKNFDPLAELKINNIGNAILKNIMAIEFLAIKFGINFPVGGSLLVVARKK